MKKQLLISILLLGTALFAQAQTVDTTFFVQRAKRDTTNMKMNMDAVYNRPLIQLGRIPAALGGYVEANSSYFATDGVSEGLSLQLPRMTLFVSSSIRNRIKFMSEIELEEGGREINIEFAAVDVEFNPLLNLRGGVVMNPIGAFNQNHDGPKWEFIDRPIASTTIIPSTWSNVGFGLFGKYARRNWVWAYEAYLTNGFDNTIIENTQGRTWFPETKQNTERFNESFNGVPLKTIKTAIRHRKIGEIGLSWMGGVYNKFEDDGLVLDEKRHLNFFAIDISSTLPTKTYLRGEWVWATINVPESYSQQFGRNLSGGFLDIVQPIKQGRMLGWTGSVLNASVRLEYTDYNKGTFNETGTKIFDEIYAIVPSISFRPSAETVFRVNYRYQWTQDLLGNPASRTAGFQFGFSTYF